MYRFGNQLFARAALSRDQDVQRGSRRQAYPITQCFHGIGYPDYFGIVIPSLVQILFQLGFFFHDMLVRQGVVDGHSRKVAEGGEKIDCGFTQGFGGS